MRYAASIVLYKNNASILEEAISSYFNAADPVSVLYLIDNSPNDDLRKMSEISNRIVYIFNASNIGFGAAHNIAIKKSMELGCLYHFVINPDVYFGKKELSKLIKFMDDSPTVGNVMPQVFYPDGKIQYLCKLLPTPFDWIRRLMIPIIKPISKFLGKKLEKRNHFFELRFTGYNKIMEVPYLSGCFMLLRLNALKNVGLFDEKIFMYGEETDLCRRLIIGGYRTVFYPKALIYHHFEKGSHKSFRLMTIAIQSAIYYFNKWGWLLDKDRKKINQQTLLKIKTSNMES